MEHVATSMSTVLLLDSFHAPDGRWTVLPEDGACRSMALACSTTFELPEVPGDMHHQKDMFPIPWVFCDGTIQDFSLIAKDTQYAIVFSLDVDHLGGVQGYR